MKSSHLVAAVLALGLVTSLSTLAQGTATGTNTNSVSAGTGNAGDKTSQPGASAAAGKTPMAHKSRRARRAASAASGG